MTPTATFLKSGLYLVGDAARTTNHWQIVLVLTWASIRHAFIILRLVCFYVFNQ
jgi:hypothetical protein